MSFCRRYSYIINALMYKTAFSEMGKRNSLPFLAFVLFDIIIIQFNLLLYLKLYSCSQGAYDTSYFVALSILLGLSQIGKLMCILIIIFQMKLRKGEFYIVKASDNCNDFIYILFVYLWVLPATIIDAFSSTFILF